MEKIAPVVARIKRDPDAYQQIKQKDFLLLDEALAQVEAEIQDILFRERVDERFVAWLSDLRKRSHIKVMGAP